MKKKKKMMMMMMTMMDKHLSHGQVREIADEAAAAAERGGEDGEVSGRCGRPAANPPTPA